jgi:hypothetical protein
MICINPIGIRREMGASHFKTGNVRVKGISMTRPAAIAKTARRGSRLKQ